MGLALSLHRHLHMLLLILLLLLLLLLYRRCVLLPRQLLRPLWIPLRALVEPDSLIDRTIVQRRIQSQRPGRLIRRGIAVALMYLIRRRAHRERQRHLLPTAHAPVLIRDRELRHALHIPQTTARRARFAQTAGAGFVSAALHGTTTELTALGQAEPATPPRAQVLGHDGADAAFGVWIPDAELGNGAHFAADPGGEDFAALLLAEAGAGEVAL